jgi:signal transduction histidine kinase/CheY-like chemotaxis protein
MAKLASKKTAGILSVHLSHETDFLLARQRAKQVAALLGFDHQDQTRIATAVSEIARNAFEYADSGRVEYFVDRDGASAEASRLRIVISDHGKGIPQLDAIWAGTYKSRTGMGLGIIGARRLLDTLDVETSDRGTVVTLVKRLPSSVPAPPSPDELARSLAANVVNSHNALRDQNQELLTLLNELRARESELQYVNQELADTNRGVLVLYTELEDKAEAVQQASEMKTRFLSGVTHELRTPLNSIVSLARLLLAHVDGNLNQEQEKQVQFILRSAQNLTEMVNDLLDLAKIEAGKTEIKRTNFTVQDLFAGLRGMFRPLVVNEAVILTFLNPEQPMQLHTDEGKLAQILRNFISNALKFTEKGSVTVSAEADSSVPEAVVFSVKDTGVGIAPEHIELVMQEWGQVEETTHNKQKGSGLGLPLARSLAGVLGGSVDFTSTPGVGSTFRVTVPGLLIEPVIEAPLLKPSSSVMPHVLMAGRDEVDRYLLRRRIAAHTTAEIAEVSTGEEVLEAIRLAVPGILFLDLVLPGLSGAEIVNRLRADPKTHELPIVVHTAKPLTDAERQKFQELDVMVIPRRGQTNKALGGANTQAENEEQEAQFERALLEVGLSNVNQRRPGA